MGPPGVAINAKPHQAALDEASKRQVLVARDRDVVADWRDGVHRLAAFMALKASIGSSGSRRSSISAVALGFRRRRNSGSIPRKRRSKGYGSIRPSGSLPFMSDIVARAII